jgi:hypothetical protein
MNQDLHTAINWLPRSKIVDILENTCGTACYDDEPTDDLRDCLRGEAEGPGEYAAGVREEINWYAMGEG